MLAAAAFPMHVSNNCTRSTVAAAAALTASHQALHPPRPPPPTPPRAPSHRSAASASRSPATPCGSRTTTARSSTARGPATTRTRASSCASPIPAHVSFASRLGLLLGTHSQGDRGGFAGSLAAASPAASGSCPPRRHLPSEPVQQQALVLQRPGALAVPWELGAVRNAVVCGSTLGLVCACQAASVGETACER
jgi:hypothetical protein